MTRLLPALCAGLCLSASAAHAAPSVARGSHTAPHRPSAATLPHIGDQVPASLLKRAGASNACDIGDGKTDPCASMAEGRDRVTVAWDATSHHVTYLYSTTLDTDNDVRAGDLLAIGSESPITPFPTHGSPHRFVTIDWCDTDHDLSADALWCAVMVPVRPGSGRVVGFVQSLYLYLPVADPEPMHRVLLDTRRSGARP